MLQWTFIVFNSSSLLHSGEGESQYWFRDISSSYMSHKKVVHYWRCRINTWNGWNVSTLPTALMTTSQRGWRSPRPAFTHLQWASALPLVEYSQCLIKGYVHCFGLLMRNVGNNKRNDIVQWWQSYILWTTTKTPAEKHCVLWSQWHLHHKGFCQSRLKGWCIQSTRIPPAVSHSVLSDVCGDEAVSYFQRFSLERLSHT